MGVDDLHVWRGHQPVAGARTPLIVQGELNDEMQQDA